MIKMTTYEATVFMNVAPDGANFFGYRDDHPLAEVPNLPLCVQADTAQDAAGLIFVVGNREGEDAAGRTWPSNVRSVSVGDVIKLVPIPNDPPACFRPVIHYLAVEPIGWRDLVEPANPIVPLVGSDAARFTCRWYALCENDAVALIAHPVITDGVPACQRCIDKHGLTDRMITTVSAS